METIIIHEIKQSIARVYKSLEATYEYVRENRSHIQRLHEEAIDREQRIAELEVKVDTLIKYIAEALTN